MSNNKKILFVLKDFCNGGGVEKVTVNLALKFKDDGHKVSFFILEKADLPLSINSCFDVIYSSDKKIIKNVSLLKKTIEDNDFDIVISAKEKANLPVFLCSFISFRFKPILSRHCAFDVSDQRLSVKGLRLLYNVYALSRSKIVAVSEELKDYISSAIIFNNKVYFCPNPVIDNDVLTKAKTNNEIFSHNTRYYCAVGRLCEQKGFDILIESYSIALKKDNDIFDLIIVGDGPDREKLIELAEELGVIDKVRFYGFSKNPYYIMANSECFLLSSRHEGLPTVLIEALAVGTKVIATDCPTGPKEILKNGLYGRLVSANDPVELANALLDVKREIEVKYSDVESYKLYTHESAANSYYKLMD